ncbi:S1 family peptidase [Natranaerobius trueperi]|uniref:S1 family peptidase n=1 Tax=Natranaerobius trueperi TaxID=759412 RepID=UPI0013039A4A|nr:serine protease [Natranaerobius trueperi]
MNYILVVTLINKRKKGNNKEQNDNFFYGDLDEENLFEEEQAERKKHVRWIASFILIIFVITVFTSFFKVVAKFPITTYFESLTLRDNQTIAEVKESVVSIIARENLNNIDFITSQTSGTGVNIDPSGKVLTNRHVIEGDKEITVNFRESNETTARVKGKKISPNSSIDLALLDIESDGELPYVDIYNGKIENLNTDKEVYVVGNPRGIGVLASKGKIRDINKINDYLSIIEIDTKIYPGHSGSPVVNSEGELLGIIYASRKTSDGHRNGLFISISSLDNLLTLNLIRFSK